MAKMRELVEKTVYLVSGIGGGALGISGEAWGVAESSEADAMEDFEAAPISLAAADTERNALQAKLRMR